MTAQSSIHFTRAYALWQLRRWPQTAEALDLHLQDVAGDAYARAMLAIALLFSPNPNLQRARDEANRAVGDAPGDAYCFYARALVARRTRLDRAAGEPVDDSQKGWRTMLWHAQMQLRKSLEIDPEFLPAWLEFAAVHERLGNSSEVDRAATRAMQIAPNDVAANNAFARALTHDLKFDEALIVARRGLSIAPDDPELLMMAGRMLRYFGDRIGAAECLRASLRIDPNNVEAQKTLNSLERQC